MLWISEKSVNSIRTPIKITISSKRYYKLCVRARLEFRFAHNKSHGKYWNENQLEKCNIVYPIYQTHNGLEDINNVVLNTVLKMDLDWHSF